MITDKVLFIGAHTDDIELGAGGLIQKCNNARMIVFSPAIESIPTEYDKDITRQEFNESKKKLVNHYFTGIY